MLDELNDLLPKLEATRTNRERAALVSAIATHNLHQIGIACAADDQTFSALQTSETQSIAAAITRLASPSARPPSMP